MRTFAILLISLAVSATIAQNATVYYDAKTGEYSLVKGVVDSKGVAFGSFLDTISSNGFSTLKIETNSLYDDEIQMFAAGYMEGALTQLRIYQNSLNVPTHLFNGTTVPVKVAQFLNDQDKWLQNMAHEHRKQDIYWEQTYLVMRQLDGLIAGYGKYCSADQRLDRMTFLVLNGAGDLFDIIPAVEPSFRPNWDAMTPDEIFYETIKRSHCSGLVRVSDDLSNLYTAHTTWFNYSWMLRIFKYYKFHLSHAKAVEVAFSSYPAALSSIDDYYLLSSGLAILETTNDVLNNSLYVHVTPKSSPCWIRIILANRLASSGKEWTDIYAKYNSGTYNNQWMVVDYKKFQPGQTIAADTLWVLEQLPGYIEKADVSQMLDLGYWPSYNVPFFPEVYVRSGYASFFKKYGDAYSYGHCPRANIFRRGVGAVQSMDDMKQFMLYNDWQQDPLSLGNACNQIAARCDLITPIPMSMGGIDSKITSSELLPKLGMWVQSGPSHNDEVPFSWSQFPNLPHYGHPETFNFGWNYLSQ